jgi:hypothetical protein
MFKKLKLIVGNLQNIYILFPFYNTKLYVLVTSRLLFYFPNLNIFNVCWIIDYQYQYFIH